MGLYRSVFLPWGIEKLMSRERFTTLRKRALAEVAGDVLEIGFGTGLNLSHYHPERVRRLVIVDSNRGMKRRATKRIACSPIEIEAKLLSAESLPLDDDSMDCVVSTWTLCSISDVEQALAEIRRVLKPQGRFIFIEHGLAPDAKVRAWQHRLNPFQRFCGGGCNLNRDMRALIGGSGFSFDELETFYMEKEPRILGFIYFGSARPV